MCKVITVELKWIYSPDTYFEEPVIISFEGVDLEIKGGIAIAKITSELFQDNNQIQQELTQQIENRLYAVQLMTHQDFELSKPLRTDILENGKINYYLNLESGIFLVDSCMADLIQKKDKDGNIISDTKRDRLDKQNHIASLLDKHRDSDDILDQMLKSFQSSVNDPANEFVHLYEIADMLSAKFESDKKAKEKLKITRDEWNQFKRLANAEPLKQGRHRGKMVGTLRNAEQNELNQARQIALCFIEKYLNYLEKFRTMNDCDF